MANKPIGTLGVVPSLTVANYVFTDIDNLVTLWASVGGNNSTLRKTNTTAGYQVPVGKSFKIYAIRFTSGSAANADLYLNYSDNDVGMGTATAPTNAVYVYDSSTNRLISQGPATISSGIEVFLGPFVVPAGKYVTLKTTAGNGTIQVFGYEV